ncbi:MAG: UDP-N-acetyl-D-mannosamine dehydrogenase [Gammaproteobacteria bacterium TMED95]|uniref:UDP-N-acetyl-D-mannosamine dehydrogenase n=1 Tax=Alteromonas mediterranea TaxID=314275 RepID=A0AAC9NU20_9ALTE|nr:UDP-N-acetyl-D-mannosamine dehydrogenase [Alteromonas mediterranea]APD92386.1 UDP-N-acetyl-D-mannosamine dehydrogenase [Alteromonas mediterranea]APE00247.1 UDP-N-acetyl-D-mannosamine dehydrogenase [Alteromonas mediterranea]OUV22173.1 MAG: UDP-N-acetyl-D-mannosamine dehydrogenase [Gammaproteobacteria bacterium TMED95]|tara:strand:- start:6060 stop:7343 length:1284 start_codon:yes stop_codon:yes gene_type:complete
MKYDKVMMVGLGYIGLPTAAVMASKGLNVVGLDVNEGVCKTINEGRIHIVEPGLEKLVDGAVKATRLRATTVAESADVFVIAVPTPYEDDYSPDLSYIRCACEMIAPVLKKGDLVVLESTSPVTTTDKLSEWLSELRGDLRFPIEGQEDRAIDVNVAYCPERVLPGKVIEELVNNDRSIGGMTLACAKAAQVFYRTFVKGDCVVTTARTAEMVKLVENSSRDVNIAFANELSLLSERFGIDVREVISLANRHPRVNILQPGAGVGGHCLAVDPWFIVHSAPDLAKIIRTAREVNDSKPMWVAEQLEKKISAFLFAHPEKSVGTMRIAFFGMAFKPNIDDLRESPAIEVINLFRERHPDLTFEVVEPNISSLEKAKLRCDDENDREKLYKLTSLGGALSADVGVVLVAHDEFKNARELNLPQFLNVAW